MKHLRLSAFVGALATVAASQAVVIMDQIGPSNNVTGNIGTASQRFEASFGGQFDAGALDNFTVTGSAFNITQVEAVFASQAPGAGGFNYSTMVQNVAIEIYSSPTAAQANLNGDVVHQVLTSGYSWNTAYTSQASDALMTATVNFNLNPGTYWLAVIPRADFGTANAQVFVYNSSYAGANPGGNDGWQANPGGGSGSTLQHPTPPPNFAYRINGNAVPEPASLAVIGVGLAAVIRRRRSK